MKYFQDITLIPDAEANLGFLWYKIFQQIHIALVENKISEKESAIAISIPEYGNKNFPLGRKLRLLAKDSSLISNLNTHKWLNRLSDYVHIKSIQEVPQSVMHHTRFSRKNVCSIERKAINRAEHLNKPYDEVLKFLLNENKNHKCELPFVHVESQSSETDKTQKKNRYPLFIEKTLFEEPIEGTFDCYGLSKTATVPWF